MSSVQSKAKAAQKEVKVSAGRFPLVHKLIQFADIRRHYKDMREALIASNRQAGSYKGWVTRWKKKYEASELAQKKLRLLPNLRYERIEGDDPAVENEDGESIDVSKSESMKNEGI